MARVISFIKVIYLLDLASIFNVEVNCLARSLMKKIERHSYLSLSDCHLQIARLNVIIVADFFFTEIDN